MSNPISINIIPAPHAFQEISSSPTHTVGQQHTENTLNTVFSVSSVLQSHPDWSAATLCWLWRPSGEITLPCRQLC